MFSGIGSATYGGCPNDKLPVVPATKPTQGQDCVSLGQTDSGIDPIIGETVKQVEMDRRLELSPDNSLVADPSQDVSPIQLERRGDKSEVDQRLEPLQDKDYLSPIQKNTE